MESSLCNTPNLDLPNEQLMHDESKQTCLDYGSTPKLHIYKFQIGRCCRYSMNWRTGSKRSFEEIYTLASGSEVHFGSHKAHHKWWLPRTIKPISELPFFITHDALLPESISSSSAAAADGPDFPDAGFHQALNHLDQFDRSNGLLIHLNRCPIKHKGSNIDLNGHKLSLKKLGLKISKFNVGQKQTRLSPNWAHITY